VISSNLARSLEETQYFVNTTIVTLNQIKDDTEGFKNNAEQFKNTAKEYRDDAWAAVQSALIETGDTNGRHVFVATAAITSGETLTLPLYYYPGRNDLMLWHQGAICSPRQPHMTSDSLYQYEEIGDDINVKSNHIKLYFDVKAGDIFDQVINSSGLLRKIEEFDAAIESAQQAATDAEESATNAETSEDNAKASEIQAYNIVNIAYLTDEEFADLEDQGLYPTLVKRLVSITDAENKVTFYGIDADGEAHPLADLSYQSLISFKTIIDGADSFAMGNDSSGGYITAETETTIGGIKLNVDKPFLYTQTKEGEDPPYRIHFKLDADGLYLSKTTDSYTFIRVPEQSDLTALLAEAKGYTDSEINAKISGVLKWIGNFIGFYTTSASEITNPETNDIALKQDGSEKATYNGTSWVIATMTHNLFDLWANLRDGHGYYWFSNEWNLLDFNVDISVKEDVANKTTSLATTIEAASNTKYPSEKAVVTGLAAISGLQHKIPAGATPGHAVLDTTTEGSVSKTAGTLSIPGSGLVVGDSTNNGAVKIKSSGTSDTTIIGPNNDTTTLVPGKMQTQIPAGTLGNLVTYSGQEGVFGVASSTSSPVLRENLTTSSVIASGASITTPSYIVGSNKLMVYWDGLLTSIGDEYNEVGEAGATSSTITVLSAVPIGTKFTFIVHT
jgi:hypothetical protein